MKHTYFNPAWKFVSVILILLCYYLPVTGQKAVTLPAAVGPVPTAEQLAWQEMELNAFIHFTTNTFTGKEWGFGDERPEIFNPSATDVDQWVSTLKAAGFKMVILTCKHHDGFCLWPSKYTDHSIKNSPYKNGKGDLVKEVSEACKKYKIKFGVYLSPWDRNQASYGKPEYLTYYRNQLKELFSDYGPVTEMWFDGANGGDGYYGGANEKRSIDAKRYYDWPTTLKLVRSFAPEVIFFSDAGPGVRWVGNENAVAGETNWNTISMDTMYAGKPGIGTILQTGSPDGKSWIPAECDVSIRRGWFYHAAEDSLVKTAEQLFKIYLTSVGRGSTLLLNVPPDKEGKFHAQDIASLQGFRKLLDKEFANNLARSSKATSTTYRGSLKEYSAYNCTDSNKNTYWATDDAITAGSVEIQLPAACTVKYVVLQEYIKLGQRVSSFVVSAWIDGRWNTIAEGTTIGYKRILEIPSIKTDKIKLEIREAKGCPLISGIEVY